MLTYQAMEGRVMKAIGYTFLLACSVFLSGCRHTGETQHRTPEKERSDMIQIQDLTLTDKTLTFEYLVSNPFEDDIRVCHAAWVYGDLELQHAITRIRDNTVRIILGNVAREPKVFQNPRPIAKYVRLAPGESYSGRIFLDLPIRDYSLEPAPRSTRPREENMDIALRRTVFEIGYLGPKLNKFFAAVSDHVKMDAVDPKPTTIGPYYYLSHNPAIIEETVDGKLREVVYVRGRSWDLESAEVVLTTDAAIPCSVPADDE